MGAIPTYDLASLTEAQARQLQGKYRVYHVHIITAPWEFRGCTLYGCWSLDWTERAVWFRPGVGEVVHLDDIDRQTEKVRLTVRGRMRVIRHRLGGTEYRVVDGEVVR